MTLAQLLSLARIRLRDHLTPYFWDDATLTEFINSAVNEACLRARLLRSNVTLAVTPGVDTYVIPYTVLKPFGALFIDQLGGTAIAGAFTPGRWYTIATAGTTNFTLVGAANSSVGTVFQATGVGAGTGTATLGNATPLAPISDQEYYYARANCGYAPTRPQFYMRGATDNSITLYPQPNLVGAVVMTISRMPAAAEDLVYTVTTGVPVIPSEFHRDLIYWVLSEAYMVDNVDSYNPKASADNEAKFEARFGRKATARGEAMGRRNIVGSDIRPQTFGGSIASSYKY
jgi:hypothetical protein